MGRVRRADVGGRAAEKRYLTPVSLFLVLYPRGDGDLSKFLQRITLTHTQRCHWKTRTAGYGHVYQGRYKSLPVESDRHFLTLVRYVERNAQRAALVKKAEDWPWSSVYARRCGNEQQKKLLSPWPMVEPGHYLEWLNASQGKEEIANIRYAIKKSRPYGSEKWVAKAVGKFGLENTMRKRGDRKKVPDTFSTLTPFLLTPFPDTFSDTAPDRDVSRPL